MKFVLGFVSLCVLLAIQDATADTAEAPKAPTLTGRLGDYLIHSDHGHAFGEGGNAGVGGVNNGNNGEGTGGSSGRITGLDGYGGGNKGGAHSTFLGR